jgi:cysteine desulfurase
VIFLDHNATSPPRPNVLEKALPFLTEHWANPSSTHSMARKPASALEDARTQVAEWAGTRPRDVIFTSGATEANHLALQGTVQKEGKCGLAVSAIEHPSVLSPAERLGAIVLPVDSNGRICLEALESALEKGVGLVSIMAANNETGVIQDLASVYKLTDAAGALLHVDAAQAAARITLPQDWDLLTLSGHKAGGLKGAGALLRREGVKVIAQQVGGDQERGMRSGTVDVAPIVGLAEAVTTPWPDLSDLRNYLENVVLELGGVVTSSDADRLPNTLHMSFPELPGEGLVFGLDLAGVCVSVGSACSSGASKPSHVMQAMGLDPARGLRFSLGWNTTEIDVETAATALTRVVAQHRTVKESW